MKLSLSAIGLLLSLGTAGVHANGRVVHPLPGDAGPVGVLPVTVDPSEPRSTSSLRDTLRQPFDELERKPFRLSSEERQRMREQLRSQPFQDSAKK